MLDGVASLNTRALLSYFDWLQVSERHLWLPVASLLKTNTPHCPKLGPCLMCHFVTMLDRNSTASLLFNCVSGTGEVRLHQSLTGETLETLKVPSLPVETFETLKADLMVLQA